MTEDTTAAKVFAFLASEVVALAREAIYAEGGELSSAFARASAVLSALVGLRGLDVTDASDAHAVLVTYVIDERARRRAAARALATEQPRRTLN